MTIRTDIVRRYFLPALLAVLLIFAFLKPPRTNLNSAAQDIERYVIGAQSEFDTISDSRSYYVGNVLGSNRIKLFLYDSYDSLYYYSTNSITPPNLGSQYQTGAGLLHIRNGWYVLLKKKLKNGGSAIGLVLIKYDFKFENKFLRNHFTPDIDIPSTYNIAEGEMRGAVAIHDSSGKVLFSLFADETKADNDSNVALALVYLLIILILGYYLHEVAHIIVRLRGPKIGVLALSITVFAIRYAMIYFKFPGEFYRQELFNPALYGSALFAESLGDLLLTCTMFFWLCAFYYKVDSRFGLSIFPNGWARCEQAFLIMLQFVASGSIWWLFKSLVMDSVISFQVYNILGLSLYSFIGLLCLTLLLVCHFLLSINAFRRLIDLKTKLWFLILFTIIGGILYVIVLYDSQFRDTIVFSTIWSLFFTLIGFRLFSTLPNRPVSKYSVIFILLYSILSMFLIENLYERKERNQRQFFAGKLVSSHDYVAEFSFDDIANRIQQDRYIKNFFAQSFITRKDLRDRMGSLYFAGYFGKYDVLIYAFDRNGTPVKTNDTVPLLRFKEIYDQKGASSTNPYLRYLNDSVSSASYMALIPIQGDSGSGGTLVMYLKPRMYNGQNVYPELLLGQNVTTAIDNTDYNFAIYYNNKLTVQHGEYPYTYYWDKKFDVAQVGKPTFIESDSWEHLVCKYDNNRQVVVSIQQEGFFEPVATVSYFFVIYFIITSIILGAINLFKLFESDRSIADGFVVSFRTRINYSMLLIIIISFIIIGSVTISFFRSQYERFYADRLQRKEKAILSGLEYFIQENPLFVAGNEYSRLLLEEELSVELVKLSEIHNVDINVYDTHGDLATASQPAIFDNGLISKKMHPTAFYLLSVGNETQYTQQENIGELNYAATYAPVRNKNGATVAYLFVPYFEQFKSINDEVSAFLVSMINAYVFLLLCAAVIAFFISNSITRPLRFISEKLRLINLNKKNEPIEWNSKDEIGILINEYNKMISELESSAAKLAKSERESAWREMARQIAHEIKNPLTPMKLSIQYLQRAIEEGNPNVPELANKVNKTLIEQIENLSSIASAFSSFAQMPKSHNEVIDLNELVWSVVGLFEKEENVHLSFTTDIDHAEIWADKNQLLSVFNNLIKNAIQSVPSERNAEVKVNITREDDYIKTTIQDNGSGISKYLYDRVFVPNFTTKTSGTGLGLAITKQIIDGCAGQIWFESTEDVGTAFFVTIPIYVAEGKDTE